LNPSRTQPGTWQGLAPLSPTSVLPRLRDFAQNASDSCRPCISRGADVSPLQDPSATSTIAQPLSHWQPFCLPVNRTCWNWEAKPPLGHLGAQVLILGMAARLSSISSPSPRDLQVPVRSLGPAYFLYEYAVLWRGRRRRPLSQHQSGLCKPAGVIWCSTCHRGLVPARIRSGGVCVCGGLCKTGADRLRFQRWLRLPISGWVDKHPFLVLSARTEYSHSR
jgi:hypothetical protein